VFIGISCGRVNEADISNPQIIGDSIEDVEALGDIGTMNLYQIGRVLAKNRSL
jgi:hypothetical protein